MSRMQERGSHTDVVQKEANMNKFQSWTIIIALLASSIALIGFLYVMVPSFLHQKEIQDIATECSQRRIGAVQELQVKTEAMKQGKTQAEQENIESMFEQTVNNLNSPQYYKDCAKTIHEEWAALSP